MKYLLLYIIIPPYPEMLSSLPFVPTTQHSSNVPHLQRITNSLPQLPFYPFSCADGWLGVSHVHIQLEKFEPYSSCDQNFVMYYMKIPYCLLRWIFSLVFLFLFFRHELKLLVIIYYVMTLKLLTTTSEVGRPAKNFK